MSQLGLPLVVVSIQEVAVSKGSEVGLAPCQEELLTTESGMRKKKSFVWLFFSLNYDKWALEKRDKSLHCSGRSDTLKIHKLDETYWPIGRVRPLWSRPPGPHTLLSIVSVPMFPLSPTKRLFFISCFEPSSWGKVPPLGKNKFLY